MRVVIVGQGAIGLLCYSQLFIHDEHQISLLCSTRLKEFPKEIQFIDLNNINHKIPLVSVNDEKLSQADVVIFCLKAFDIVTAIHDIAAKTSINTPLVLAHNGMIDTQEISKTIKTNHPLLTLLTTHGCKKERPMVIRHTGTGHSDIGLKSSQLAQPNSFSFSEKQQIVLFNTLKFMLPTLSWSENIKEKQWEKLAVNCVINPITAIKNIDNGEILTQKYRIKIKTILQEIILIAEQQGILLNFEKIEQAVLNVAKLTARNSSSMRCDILAKRASEIDHINGYIVELGKKYGIATPINTQLWQQIKNLEQDFLSF